MQIKYVVVVGVVVELVVELVDVVDVVGVLHCENVKCKNIK